MACKKRSSISAFFALTASVLAAVCLTACSSKQPELPVAEPVPVAVIPVEEPAPPAEPTLEERVETLNATAAADTVLFISPAPLPAGDRLARKRETALGDFLADAERGFLAEHDIQTDFALLNAELIRSGLPEGPVTKQDIERTLPFGQTIVVAEMSGSVLLDLFSEIGTFPQGSGGFAQVSKGVSYTLSFDETGFGTYITNVLVDGVPVEAERTYRVALNDFMAEGGNGYSFFLRNDVVKVTSSVSLSSAVADYCAKHAELLYMNQGERITIQGGITE